MSLLSGYFALGKGTNTVNQTDREEGAVSDLLPELVLEMKDEELIELKNQWLRNWTEYAKAIEVKQKENEEYWMGKQFGNTDEKRPLVDNLIFESLETFLPIATRAKADPLVESDNTEEGIAIADKVRKMIAFIADNLSYNLKVKQVVRYWALYMLGVMKVGWSMKENDITCVSIRPQKLVLDPKATIEDCEYKGYYIGEYLEDMASDLVARFKDKEKIIKDKVKDKMGTTVSYIMWTTDDYVFWTLDNEVLGKNKNPHWNYETKQPAPVDAMGNVPSDPATGEPVQQDVPGVNHFKSPQKPYIFLSVFNLGKRPHDETNLIEQNLPLQDLVNKRLSQIDRNADNANGGIAVSGDAFTEEQAAKISKSRRKGGTLWIPTGDVNNAVKDLPAQPLPNFIYESLIDYRNELRNIFGTRGSTPQGTSDEKTVGGKKIISGQDSDRIGGGVSTYLEQFSDRVFNWFVQLMHVYYDEEHTALVLGKEKARELITLKNTDLPAKLLVGVKEGSMIPHDPVSQREEAVELWAAQGIDPISFFDRLEFPNPREAAKQLFLWKSDPIQLFPDLLQQQQEQQMMQMQQQQIQQSQENAQKTEGEQRSKQQDHENKLEQVGFANLMKQQ